MELKQHILSSKFRPLSTINKIKWLLGIGIIMCIVFPALLAQPYLFKALDFSNSGEIGDTIGGITAPIVNIIGSILVFFALRAQIDANNLIQLQFQDQKNEELDRKKLLYITDQINIIRIDIREFTFTHRDGTFKYNYTGSDAIYQFFAKY